MTSEQFTYWLQGFFELSIDGCSLTKREQIIKDHLKEVFNKVTPEYSTTIPGAYEKYSQQYIVPIQNSPGQSNGQMVC